MAEKPQTQARQYDFTTFSAQNPNTPHQGNKIDQELDRALGYAAGIAAWVGTQLADDGSFKIGTITRAQLLASDVEAIKAEAVSDAIIQTDVRSREWAEKLDGPIDDGFYSSRFYSILADGAATLSAAWAVQAQQVLPQVTTIRDQTAALRTETQDFRTAANNAAEAAAASAQVADTKSWEALGHAADAFNAKFDAEAAEAIANEAATRAENWADRLGSMIPGTTRYSARYWADVAATAAGESAGVATGVLVVPFGPFAGEPKVQEVLEHNYSAITAEVATRASADANLQTQIDGKAPTVHNHDGRYYTKTEADGQLATKSNVGHLHDDRYYPRADVDGLLAAKSNVGHGHTIADTTGLQTALDGKSNTGHAHTTADVTDLAPTLAAAQAAASATALAFAIALG
jgi:hypothetical protein